MRILKVISILLGTAFLPVSCQDASRPVKSEQPSAPSPNISFKITQDIASQISRVELRITGPEMPAIVQELSLEGTTITGFVSDIPVGNNRLFTLNGFDSEGKLLYTGETLANIQTGEIADVQISMQNVANFITANVRKWDGNGNHYISWHDPMTWAEARAFAASLEFEGVAGHLATITSAGENSFIQNFLGSGWIGGIPSRGWQRAVGRLAVDYWRTLDLRRVAWRTA